MPPTYSPMLASSGLTATGAGWVFEPKLDGWRVIVTVVDGKVTVRSRNGHDITDRLPELDGFGDLVADAVLDGELVAHDGSPTSFYRVAPRMAARRPMTQARHTPLCLAVFDVLWHDGIELTAQPYAARRDVLTELALSGPAWATVPVFDDLESTFVGVVELGLEGLVAKRPSSRYRPGERSRSWVKVKTLEWRRQHAPHRRSKVHSPEKG